MAPRVPRCRQTRAAGGGVSRAPGSLGKKAAPEPEAAPISRTAQLRSQRAAGPQDARPKKRNPRLFRRWPSFPAERFVSRTPTPCLRWAVAFASSPFSSLSAQTRSTLAKREGLLLLGSFSRRLALALEGGPRTAAAGTQLRTHTHAPSVLRRQTPEEGLAPAALLIGAPEAAPAAATLAPGRMFAAVSERRRRRARARFCFPRRDGERRTLSRGFRFQSLGHQCTRGGQRK